MRALVCSLLLGWVVACAPADPPDIDRVQQALDEFPNEEPAFDYFVGKGLTEQQSAGIVGNLAIESGVDPAIVSPGGAGHGIAQWQRGGRWDTSDGDNVLDYAAERGADPRTLPLQLDFIWYELTTFPDYGLAELRATTTVAEAVTTFAAKFEGCSACANQKRIDQANYILERFGGGAPSGSSSSGGAPVEPCTLDDGATGECLPTASCDDRGGTSSPGFCPGPSDIQCCTGISEPSGSSGSSNSSSSGRLGSSSGEDDSENDEPPTSAEDGGCRATGSAVPGGSLLLALSVLLCARRRS